MTELKNILFVDDERSVLCSLRRAFIKSGHKLYFADPGELDPKIPAAGQGLPSHYRGCRVGRFSTRR